MSASRRAQSVSNRLPPRGTTRSCEKSPTQRRPEMTRTASRASGNEQSSLTRDTNVLQGHQVST
jgi:hypothetical protein